MVYCIDEVKKQSDRGLGVFLRVEKRADGLVGKLS
jgi:hypothetical protein